MARALVEYLAGRLPGAEPCQPRLVERIEVWTTCALDHRTWANHYAPGTLIDNGILVRRFPVAERNLEVFINFELNMAQGLSSNLAQQLDWLENSVNSHELYRHIYLHQNEFDAILFAPYLFATSFWGALIAPQKSILIPCLHNEAYAYLEVFRYLFGKVRGFIFNAEKERELTAAIYNISDLEQKSAVVGMGFIPSLKQENSDDALRENPFLLYSGRKETGKNLDLLIECFVKYREAYPQSKLELCLMGSGSIDFLKELPAGVIDLGFVSEEEKEKLMSQALALCQPSTNESFSIVLMEAWLRKTPVIVHENCAVTADHAIKSGGGLYFSNEEDFIAVADLLYRDKVLATEMGEAGYRYVTSEYCWEAVGQRLVEGLDKILRREIENKTGAENSQCLLPASKMELEYSK